MVLQFLLVCTLTHSECRWNHNSSLSFLHRWSSIRLYCSLDFLWDRCLSYQRVTHFKQIVLGLLQGPSFQLLSRAETNWPIVGHRYQWEHLCKIHRWKLYHPIVGQSWLHIYLDLAWCCHWARRTWIDYHNFRLQTFLLHSSKEYWKEMVWIALLSLAIYSLQACFLITNRRLQKHADWNLWPSQAWNWKILMGKAIHLVH